jgi:hypothetical protein
MNLEYLQAGMRETMDDNTIANITNWIKRLLDELKVARAALAAALAARQRQKK